MEEEQHSPTYLPCKLWQDESCPVNVRVVVLQTPIHKRALLSTLLLLFSLAAFWK